MKHFAHKIAVSFFLIAIVLCSMDKANSNVTMLKMPGEYFRACLVAYSDFKKMITEENKGGSDRNVFFSRIENYDIRLVDKGKLYYVEFSPKDSKGLMTLGVGAEYWIRKDDFEITKKNYME